MGNKPCVEDMEGLNIYKGKKVLVTGHTGFKGCWLSIWLCSLGAKVIGYSSDNWNNDFLYKETKLKDKLFADVKGDIRDLKKVKETFDKYKPEIVFHLAAQPIVRTSYDNPVETFEINVIGTANILDCIKNEDSVKSAVLITTDKVYKNKESSKGYNEEDELGGHDPYSASKACAEIVIDSYRKSFFNNTDKLIASARAGNVVGGGDMAKDRLIPDCIKSINEGKTIDIRSPDSVRPWQHVLEPLSGYLLLGKSLIERKKEFASAWNFGPEKESQIEVKKVADFVVKYAKKGSWKDTSDPNEKKHETKLLMLDIHKAKTTLKWHPKFDIQKTIKNTVEWYMNCKKDNPYMMCIKQIEEYEKL